VKIHALHPKILKPMNAPMFILLSNLVLIILLSFPELMKVRVSWKIRDSARCSNFLKVILYIIEKRNKVALNLFLEMLWVYHLAKI
jgi:hypothetical protein